MSAFIVLQCCCSARPEPDPLQKLTVRRHAVGHERSQGPRCDRDRNCIYSQYEAPARVCGRGCAGRGPDRFTPGDSDQGPRHAMVDRASLQPASTSDFDDGWGTPRAGGRGRDAGAGRRKSSRSPSSRSSPATTRPTSHFDLSINPYRGCEHGCIYCFARPTHSYLNLSPGLDFETRIIAKVNAAERVRETFARRGYRRSSSTSAPRPTPISRSSASCGITRSVIEVLAECRHPFSLVTKSSGVERDLDLIAPMAAERLAAVYVSVTSLDPALARILEPRAAAPHRRLQTIETLARRRRAGRRERLADHSVHQRARNRTHARGRGGARGASRASASCCGCPGR